MHQLHLLEGMATVHLRRAFWPITDIRLLQVMKDMGLTFLMPFPPPPQDALSIIGYPMRLHAASPSSRLCKQACSTNPAETLNVALLLPASYCCLCWFPFLVTC